MATVSKNFKYIFKIVAVFLITHSLPCIRIYSLSSSTTDGDVSLFADLKQEITLKHSPWDICCDQSDFVWILQPVEGETLTVWSFCEGQLCQVSFCLHS